MVKRTKLFQAGLVVAMLATTGLVLGAPLPDTESGDVIIRALDVYNVPGLPTYLGHSGIFGQWNGNNPLDPADFYIYDMQGTTNTVRSYTLVPPSIIASSTTIVQRTFSNFTLVNALVLLNYLSYDGGYTRAENFVSAPGQAWSPTLRQAILDEAQSWIDRSLTTSLFRFTKNPAQNTFRCDSWVEYVYELAGVNNGAGLWKIQFENLVPSPAFYASLGGQKEPGRAPSLSVTTIGGGTVNNGAAISSTSITVTTVEEATGSGLSKIVLTGPSAASTSFSGTVLSTAVTYSNLAD